MEEAIRFTYVGPPAHASALAQALQAEGLSTDYQPPFETKDLATAMSAVAVVFAVTGPLRDIVAGVHAFTARHPGTRVDGLPKEPGQTIQERLATLDELRGTDAITAEEHAHQRHRILGEL